MESLIEIGFYASYRGILIMQIFDQIVLPEWERAEYFAFQTFPQWHSKNLIRYMYMTGKSFKKKLNKKSNFDGVSATFLEGQNSFNKFQMAGFFGETILIRSFLQ